MATRFSCLTEEEIEELRDNRNRENTKKVVKSAVKLFKTYLLEKKEDVNFEEYTNNHLDSILSQFFANLRTEKGQLYKVNSLASIKYGIWKHMKDKGTDIDSAEFEKWQETFKAVKVRSTRQGKGSVDHKQAISNLDLEKLYDPSHHTFDTSTPQGLQQKVFFEIILHLCRRGRENLRSMTKETFVIGIEDGKKYLCQKASEENKNHGIFKFDDTIGEGRMYADEVVV